MADPEQRNESSDIWKEHWEAQQLPHIQKSQLRWFQYLLMLRVGNPRVAPEHAGRITV